MTQNHHKFCIAPMMKKTDKHFRFMARQFTKNSMLYTEMIHSNAILKGDVNKLLKFDSLFFCGFGLVLAPKPCPQSIKII